MIELLKKLENLDLLTENEIKRICYSAIEILILEPNLPQITSPVMICGDIHGQFFDLLNIFHLHQTPQHTKYIFLGDYVDRGYQSIETYLTLLIYKCLYPDNITLIRGNHESSELRKDLGFLSEIRKRYPQNSEIIHKIISNTFRFLNVGAIVDGRLLCVHGGLSPDLMTVQEMELIDRFNERIEDPYNDVMWGDPYTQNGFVRSTRGIGFLYGADVVKTFLTVNGLSYLIRAHQFMKNGFGFHFPDKNCITVWSAPTYMYFYDNVASVLKYNGSSVITKKDFLIFTDVHKKHNQKRRERIGK